MSVTIGMLVAEYNSATFEERQRTKDIEVVPRKIVEDIIETCLGLGEVNYDKGVANEKNHRRLSGYMCYSRSRAYENVAQIVHELLEKFEGEDDERNNNNRE
jgi:hypothetical protein